MAVTKAMLPTITLISLILASPGACAPKPQPRAASIDTSTLNGKFFAGYQGWFRKPGEDDGNSHWTQSGPSPQVGDVGVDFLPNVTGYPTECLFDTPFTLPGGGNASFYSSDCEGIVDLHFSMMADNGIDGAFMQRFYGYITDTNGGWNNILGFAITAAEKYGRGLVIEYDLSGASTTSSNIAQTILDDLNSLSSITSSSSYMHQNGKPVVEIWGLGIRTDVTVDDATNIVNAVKGAGWYTILGVQQAWRSELSQSGSYGPVYELADMIQPWTVGSYDNSNYPSFHSGQQVDDAAELQSRGIESSIVCWPGASSANSNVGTAPFDGYPRFNGSYYKAQLDGAVDLKPNFIFGAMFDEMNEGTSIFPVLRVDELPTNQQFVGIDSGMDPSFYLNMAGQAGSQLAAKWT